MKYILCFAIILISKQVYAANCSNKEVKKLVKKIGKCNKKKVHLTFDDGPDPKVTPLLLNELNKRDVKTTFYISTARIDGKPNKILKSMLNSGHIIASHGHHHVPHDLRLVRNKNGKMVCDERILSEQQSQKEMELSTKLLNSATNGAYEKQKYSLFRFPYGRGAMPSALELDNILRYGGGNKACSAKKSFSHSTLSNYVEKIREYRDFRSKGLQRLHSLGQDHVSWNFDAKDSESKMVSLAKKNNNAYVEDVVSRLCDNESLNIVALFHDNGKLFNVEAVGKIIDAGRCLGLSFVGYDEVEKDKLLHKKGVILNSPRLEKDYIGELINKLNLVREEQAKIGGCEEEKAVVKQTCNSSNGRIYKQCQGETSICVNGKWMAKTDVKEVGRYCPGIYKTCTSTYTKQEYLHCEGGESICINGKWVSNEAKDYFEHCF